MVYFFFVLFCWKVLIGVVGYVCDDSMNKMFLNENIIIKVSIECLELVC